MSNKLWDRITNWLCCRIADYLPTGIRRHVVIGLACIAQERFPERSALDLTVEEIMP